MHILVYKNFEKLTQLGKRKSGPYETYAFHIYFSYGP